MNPLGLIQNNDMPSSGYNPLRVALDPNDPQFLKKLGMIGAMEGQHELNMNAKDDAKAALMPPATPTAMKPNEPAEAPEKMESLPPPNISMAPAYPAGADIPSATDQTGTGPSHPPQSVLGKIGHALGVAGNIAGDIVAPGTMALIPGTELHNEREKAIQFRRNLEQERMQEEMDYRNIMGKVAMGREQTGERAESSKETAEKFNEDYKDRLLDFQKGKTQFDEAIASGKLDVAHAALQARLEQMHEMFIVAKDRLGLEGARNQLQEQLNGIRQEMVDVSKLGLTQRGTEEGVKAEQSLNSLVSQHWLEDAFGDFDDLKKSLFQSEPLPGASAPPGGAAPKTGTSAPKSGTPAKKIIKLSDFLAGKG